MITGLICILVGVTFLAVPRKLAKSFIAYQNKAFGFRFGKGWIDFTFVVNIVVGFVFIAIGTLTTFKDLK